jgi:hypothetical protein
MLQTSPVLSSSPNSSSAVAAPFYHGPARASSSQDSPHLLRRASTRSHELNRSPSQPRGKAPGAPAVAVAGPSRHDAPSTDNHPAATSTSPPLIAQQVSATVPVRPPQPTLAGPETMPKTQEAAGSAPAAHSDEPASSPSLPSSSAAAATAPAVGSQPRGAMSPNKRRGSPAPTIAQAVTAAGEGSSQAANAKRPRPDEPSPKTLPRKYEHCAVEDMVELIAHMVGELIATNDAIRMSNGGLTRFHSRTAPGISVRDYLHRLAKHATLTPPLLLSMVYYIDRLCALYPEFTINTLTVHRFLITAATVAAKGLSDSFWNNTTYARVGGVRVAELKMLELEFLYRVDWRIVPNPEILVAYYKGLVERTPAYVLEAGDSSGDDAGDDDEEEEEEDSNQ